MAFMEQNFLLLRIHGWRIMKVLSQITPQCGQAITSIFFIQRKIYGIGKLVNVGSDCKFFNFPGASNAQPFAYLPLRPTILWDEGDVSINQRCICVFEPDLYFFRDYAMIRAFFVAYDFDQSSVEHKRTVGVRRYTVGVRPAQSMEWSNVKLVRYAFNAPLNRIDFTVTD